MDKKKYILRFLIIVAVIVCVFLVFVFGAVEIYNNFGVRSFDPLLQKNYAEDNTEETTYSANGVSAIDNDVLKNAIKMPERTNFMLIGVDKKGLLTDTMMVGCYISSSGKINLLSVPRDTRVVVDSTIMKLNGVNGYYGGGSKGIKKLISKVENMLSIKIDYYVKIDTTAFKKVVDDLGGIDYDVPMRMFYNDPTQDLYINLQPGMQHLNGEQAEGLVRFRSGYTNADLDRMPVQRDFIKELITQIMDKDNIMSNLSSYIETFIKYVDTDFGVADVPSFIAAFGNIDTSKMKMGTLPGHAEYINGVSYYILDEAGAIDMVNEYFYGVGDDDETESTTEEEETADNAA
jgi:LCP family protein required for cell wall assembly